ncbi:DUF2938 domain-containing protein [Pseudoalteromonas sp. McH1-7]|uniref:DUF2938 domain-containing protein n=1 Tax=Pseudoalteromonas peptidolytica F12-50-A1 TaxID=1315280 RepID=A0A8I0MVJ3_9GAMM|nr:MULTISPECIES: DUF2938 domain-containing protein [Pseudoalteromonas]NUZ13320.1 DUF2938 domain-containing protein [Pseudoalteromonas sp. McH1-7]MBE0346659.1 hypothetical protein [Pseudoalteromonas peptidolytica F12-50-A1]MDW7549845.1 DUF2938 domain-containing protein [Pseudoalteromonas peptidolytica]NLR13578.1 DUF2938 domain-containing protein [Pseudoalteromonas peptidolytica]RXF06941.1 DUF2938 domain-containing protein [Pseudoalteromonas sp. PS5]
MEKLEILLLASVIGIGATIVMDIYGALLMRIFAIARLDYALLGRWVGHFLKGKVSHNGIARSAPIARETILGWLVHYVTGVVFVFLFLVYQGKAWVYNPDLWSVLAFGALTTVFPYFIMQPCFGMGIAASKLPNPQKARVKTLATHLVFGAGMYFSTIALTSF